MGPEYLLVSSDGYQGCLPRISWYDLVEAFIKVFFQEASHCANFYCAVQPLFSISGGRILCLFSQFLKIQLQNLLNYIEIQKEKKELRKRTVRKISEQGGTSYKLFRSD